MRCYIDEELAELIRIEAVKLVHTQARSISRFFCRFDVDDQIFKYKQIPGKLANELHHAMEKDVRLIYEIYHTDLKEYSKKYLENKSYGKDIKKS